MNDIKKTKFLIWLTWAIFIACTGVVGIIIWAIVQMLSYKNKLNIEKESDTPPWLRSNIVEMNKNQNLTTEEKLFIFRQLGYYYKIGIDAHGNTRYQYDDLKKFWKNVSYSKTAIDVWSKEWALLHEQDYIYQHGVAPKYSSSHNNGWDRFFNN